MLLLLLLVGKAVLLVLLFDHLHWVDFALGILLLEAFVGVEAEIVLREGGGGRPSADHHQLFFVDEGSLVDGSCAHLVLLYLHVGVGGVRPGAILDLLEC